MTGEALVIDLPGDILTKERRKRADIATGIAIIALRTTVIAMVVGITVTVISGAVSVVAMAVVEVLRYEINEVFVCH